jgi:hypothetical protein
MRVYDMLGPYLLPYVTFGALPGFRSQWVNIDANGFRVSYQDSFVIDSTSWWQRQGGLLLGGSLSFGVGATRDSRTISSMLSNLIGRPYLNLGIKAANSTQELISAIPFLQFASTIVVCTGVNNLVASLQSSGRNELFGPLFNEVAIEELSRKPLLDLAAEVRYGPLDQASSPRRAGVSRRSAGISPPIRQSLVTDTQQAIRSSAARHGRDLEIIVRASPARILFAIQPLASTCAKEPTREEAILFELTDRWQGPTWPPLKEAIVEAWPSYVAELEAICRRLGVEFVDLSDTPYRGWCFVDRAHMTDSGYEQTAERLTELLSV